MIERKAFIRSFINEVKVTDSNVEVNYRNPTSACGCKEEKSQVLDIVHYGGRYRTIDRTFQFVFSLVQEKLFAPRA